jgi:guanylate kinase
MDWTHRAYLHIEPEADISTQLQQGVKQIRASGQPGRFIFIAPPSFEELERRLRGRGTENEDAVTKRLAQARNELEYAKTPGVHDITIVNDDLDRAYKELEDFVYRPAA